MSNVLSDSKWKLDEIANRNEVDKIIDLCLQAWMHAKYSGRIEFCGPYAMPRDYHWYRHLVNMEGKTVMVHWLYARYGEFNLSELKEVLRHLQGNLVYGEQLMLFPIAESRESFRYSDEWL